MNPLSRRALILGSGAAAVLAACSRATRTATRPTATTAATSSGSAPSATTETTALPGGPARAIAHGRRDGAQVALTFHASGDLGLADRLLAAARDADAPITVFAVGRWLDENPQMARRILDGGHELANHTYTHPALATLGREAVASEITRCRDVLARLTGTGTRWFRPSGVEHATPLILEEAGAAGYPVVVEFDVDPLDYDDPGPAAIEQRVRAGLQAGSIVSLHFGHAGTVEAFPQLVADARARGLTPVRVRELLS